MKRIGLTLLAMSMAGTVFATRSYAADTDSAQGAEGTETEKSSWFSRYIPNVSGILPEAKLAGHTDSLKRIYAGAGITKKLLHGNAEWVNPYGIAYSKAGVFYNDDHEFGAQVGFRFPYYLTGTDQNGYYFGFYAGHLESVSVDGELHQRLGAGIDLAYVMLDRERISTLSIGIGAGEKIEGRNGTVNETKPQLLLAYSLSFGMF